MSSRVIIPVVVQWSCKPGRRQCEVQVIIQNVMFSLQMCLYIFIMNAVSIKKPIIYPQICYLKLLTIFYLSNGSLVFLRRNIFLLSFQVLLVELMKTPPKVKTSWHLSHCTWYLKNMLRILQMILLRSFLTLQENLEYLQCASNTSKLTSVKKTLNLEKLVQCQFWKY